ncbi:sulfotransferase [Butyrivibrio proteoclasticus]|uniref:sulfotransferase n=1 Tax=Butyrivibrio proteoclasticus TaxID=43305 RepID=UPI00047E1797|nr:sulfotransferase [Butyrivibrio proteoclasticus]
MIVTSAGFGFTGSTAITDLISEYEGVYTPKVPSYELGFFTHPNGIFNLYNYLINNNIPDLKYYAGMTYMKQCEIWAHSQTQMNYEIMFNNKFIEYSKEYIESLGGDEFYIIHDWSDNTAVQRMLFRIINKLYTVTKKMRNHNGYGIQSIEPLTLFSAERKNYLYDVDDEKFVEKTKEYFRKLFGEIGMSQVINLHGMVPIQQIDKCTRFFDDIKVIAIERDPRDIYLTAKNRWKTLDYPYEDIEFFCKYYKWLRANIAPIENSKVMKLQFEDLVYRYEETKSKIEEFLNLNSVKHINKNTRFIPEKSSKGCNLKEAYPEEKDNIAVIENRLAEWLYDF